MRKRLLTFLCLLLGMGGVIHAQMYGIDKEFTSIADLNGKQFMIVNKTDSKAIYNPNDQNLAYGTYVNALSGKAKFWKLESLADNTDASVHNSYRLRLVLDDGSNVSFWGWVGEAFLNTGRPDNTYPGTANPFNGCFVLGFGNDLGQDLQYGAVWDVEYVSGQGWTLKNKATSGYFAGDKPAPTGTTPIYWTFCTLKQTGENPIAQGAYDATDAKTDCFSTVTTIDGNASWDANTRTFTHRCGFVWGNGGIDLSHYRYIVITAAQSRYNAGAGNIQIKDANGVTVQGDDYTGGPYALWLSLWNAVNSCVIDLENLRSQKMFDIYHVTELSIDGGDKFILGDVYATNFETATTGRWASKDGEGNYRIKGLSANQFGTIRLPYQAAVSGAYIYEIVSQNDDGYKLKKHEGLMEAGVTYVFQHIQGFPDGDGNYHNDDKNVYFYQATAATLDGVTLEHKALKATLEGDFLTVQTIKKGAYNATDANTTFFANFGPIAENATYNSETKVFTGNCGWQWSGNGLDLDKYQYIVITVAQNVTNKGCKVHIKDKSGVEVSGDDYGAAYMNMWIGAWNNHNCLKIDVEKLRTEKEFDIHHIAELWIEAGDGLILGNAYATNQVPENNKNWNNEESGDFKVTIANNSYGVVRLPFPASVAGAFVYEIDNITNDGIQIGAKYDGILQAGKRYIFKSNENIIPDVSPNAGVYFYKATAQTVTTTQEGIALCGTLEGNVFKLNNVGFTGLFYVQNAESGKYMAAGHNYGTRAIVNEVGLDLTLKANDFKLVTFDSQVSNGGNNHFMNITNGTIYMDQGSYSWCIEQVGEDTYSISNGTKYIGVDADDNLALVDNPVAWKFVSADAVYAARLATLSEASEKNPVDATFLLKNPNFNRNDQRVSAWTVSENCTNKNLNGGNQVNNCAESHHSTFTISQTVNGAPAGLYKMEAQGFYRQDDGVEEDNPVFYITDGTHEDTKRVPVRTGEENNMSDASVSFSKGLYECNPLEGKITGKLEVGVRGTATHQWVIFDNFRLTYLGPIPADPTLMDPVMATAKKLATDPYKTEGKETLQEAITAAQTAVAYSASYNYTEFEAEVKKLQAAIDAFEKANRIVKEGTFYVQHVNSGKYMAAGHNWGTRGIVNETGIDLTLAANADNTVTVETQVSNGGAQHFLGDGLYMDQNSFGWWIGKYEDGTFSLSNGTKYVDVDDEGNLVFVDNPVGWQFITPENWQKGQLAKLDAATPENGVDATWMLKNPNFNRNDQRVSAWTTSGSNINLNGGENNSGTNMNNCGEAYHSKFTVSQKVEGARSGIYVLEAQGFYRQDGDAAESTPEFFIKDNTKNVENDSVTMAVTVSEEYKALGEGSMSSASELFSEGKYDHKLAQCKIKGDFTVGVRTKGENQWVIFDNYRLTYYGPIPAEMGQMEPVLAEAKKLAADKMKTEGKDALNAAITAAEASAANYVTLTYDEFGKEVDKLKTAVEAFKKANRKRMTGVYYVQNVASGKYMSAGHNWGTQAIVDEVGLDMTLKANSKDNKVSFDSQVSNGGNNHFLNSGLYMDGTSFDWSIEKMGDNVYSISDGTKFINVDENDNLVMSEEPAAWRFVTLEERMATLEDASEDDGVDATFLVKDYNLGRNNQRVSGWTVSDDCNKNFMTLGGPADKNIANYSGETWHTTFTISQTLNEMPIGIYGLKAQGFYRQDGEVAEAAPVFFINEERKELPVLTGETGNMEGAAIVLGNGEYAMEEPILCTVKDGQITLGVNGIASSQWVSFDNFRLIYYGLSGEDVTNPPVAKKELVYTGKSQVLIEAGSHEVGEIQYSLDKENFSTELPQATNAGSYSIWYRVVDENNEPLLSVKKITANIAPVNATDYISMELADAGTTYTYDATAKEPEVIVKGGIKRLTAGTDYVVTYEDNVNAGTAKAILTGLGNYKGTIVAPFNIEKAEMTLLVLADTVLVYNEEEQTVELDSVMAGELMIPADAYTVEGNVQSAVGRYTVVVTANEESNFVGELTAEFEIIGRDIAGCEMMLKSYKEYFTGYERKPAVIVTRGEIELTEGVDYIVSYENNINAGVAKAIVAGIGNYSGTNEQEFTIVTGDGQLTMLNDTVTISYITTGFSVRPIKLTGDGNLTYTSSNEEVAQVNYKTGEITINNVGETIITAIMKNTKNATSDTITCLLVVKPASEWQVTAIRTSSIYELPAFRVTSSKETLVEGRDYTMSYKNLEGREVTEAEMVAEHGMYTAVVNLKGNYTGTIERDILVQITATDIDGVKSDLNGKIRYDMSGRRVKNYRGIVIEDGQVRAVKK